MAKLQALILIFFLTSTSLALKESGDENYRAMSNPYSVYSMSSSTLGTVAYAKYTLGDYLGGAPENIIPYITVNITYDNSQRIRIKITDTNNTRWEVPYSVPASQPVGPKNLYDVVINQNPLGIQVTRNSDGKNIFNLSPNSAFLYNDQDISFTNMLNYNVKVLGLGERVTSFVLNQGDYTL